MKHAAILAKILALVVTLALPTWGEAQGIIQRATSPYESQPDISFLVSSATIAPKVTAERTVAIQTSASTTPKPAAAVFEVLASDHNVREVLQRWAGASGWTHQPMHWTLTKDFPLEGTAGADYFGTDFREAARKLLSSTEGTDLPAQPCFYSNFIVRVVPLSEICDRASSSTQ